MDWDDLRYLLALGEGGSMAAAARRLRVDQATVGRRLAALQRAAAVPLFERVPGGTALTAAGERAVQAARAMDDAAAALDRQLAAADRNVAGRVRLTAPDTVASAIIAPRLATLRARHPGLDVELVASARAVSLSRREADVAVRLFRPAEPALVARRAGEIAFGLYASPAYLRARRSAALRAHDILGYDASLAATPHGEWLEQAAAGARFVLRTNSSYALLEAAAGGAGVALLPCFLGDRDKRLRRLAERVPGPELWVVVHEDLRAAPRVRAALAFLDDALKALQIRNP